MAKYVNANALWEKLIAQREQNINCDVPFQVNMGINQAIGILNSMEPKDVIYWNDKTSIEARKQE